MPGPIEMELKLIFDPADAEALAAATELAAAAPETTKLTSTYFDTPDQRLRAEGYTLRIRRDGRKRTQTIKAGGGAAGLFVRPEWERRVPGNQPLIDEASGPLRHMLDDGEIARLAPAFTIAVERQTRIIERGGTRIECAIDRGTARSGRRSSPVCEIEFELIEGDSQPLFDLARALNEVVPLRLGALTKSDRGYALVAGDAPRAHRAEPVAIDRDDDVATGFARIAASCLRHFRMNEDLLRTSEDAEAVHQARVALRRLRSAFAMFRPLIADDARAKLIEAELRWLAAELGKVRDIDVLVPRLEGEARAKALAARRIRFDHAMLQLASGRTRLLMIDLTEWIALGDWRTRPADRDRIGQDMAGYADTLFGKLRRRIKRDGRDLAGIDDAARHEVRKDAKKLRYAADFLAALYAKRKAARRHAGFLPAIEKLQDHLGALNDMAAAPALLAELGIDAAPPEPKRGRKATLRKAEKALDALLDAKRFWRD